MDGTFRHKITKMVSRTRSRNNFRLELDITRMCSGSQKVMDVRWTVPLSTDMGKTKMVIETEISFNLG